MPIPAVVGIKQFAPAIIAQRRVWGDLHVTQAVAAGKDCKPGLTGPFRQRIVNQTCYLRQGRQLCCQAPAEAIQRDVPPLHLQLDTGRHIAHPAGQTCFNGQSVDKGPESHPLYNTSDLERPAGYLPSSLASQAYQASSPWPVVAESSMIGRLWLT